MKKILIEGMSGNLGGIETFVHLLYSVLRNDYQVDFITVDENIPYEEEFLAHGCKIHRVTPRYKSVKNYCADIDAVFANENYDAFWFNKTTLSSIYSIKSAKKHGVRKIIVESHQSKNMGNFLTYVMHTVNRARIGRLADVKAACSKEAAGWFFEKNDPQVVIFPNAVDTALYAPDAEKQRQAKKMLGMEDQFLIGSIARFAPEKNHAFVLEVFAEILKKCDARLVLCGAGQLEESIRQIVREKHMEDKVSFLGMRKDMPQIYQALDVVLMPSLFEGLPFTLVEAQASGIPCVVSDTVSPEANLTDLMTYMSLEQPTSAWAEKIISFRGYQKVSKEDQLAQKGFTVEAFSRMVRDILK